MCTDNNRKADDREYIFGLFRLRLGFRFFFGQIPSKQEIITQLLHNRKNPKNELNLDVLLKLREENKKRLKQQVNTMVEDLNITPQMFLFSIISVQS